MPDDLSPLLSWTFISETGIPKDVDKMLIDGEHAVAAYRTLRDVAIFTDKRIIVRDSQGLTGTKTEIYTLPYSSINMYSSENAGIIDKLTYVSSAGGAFLEWMEGKTLPGVAALMSAKKAA